MADQDHFIIRLAQLVASFDDTAWIALANKGLYRRAKKDLEKGVPVSVGDVIEQGLQIQVGEFTITVPEAGPGQATCTCPSPGVCQHILTACLNLKELSFSEFTPDASCKKAPSQREGEQKLLSSGEKAGIKANEREKSSQIEEELLSVTHQQLRKWAGSADFKAAVKLTSTEQHPVIEEGNPLVIKLPACRIECHCPIGVGLDGMIVTGSVQKRKQFIVAAILIFQQLRGKSLPDIAAKDVRADNNAARPRQEVLGTVQQVLEDAVGIGLAHVSQNMCERLTTLAVSAQGVKLHRLSLELRGLAEEAHAMFDRLGHADSGRLFIKMTKAYALAEALRHAGASSSPDLVGWSKSHYDEIQSLALFGVGAYPWQTRSGYRGLTVLFWNNSQHAFFSWTDTRPERYASGFDPVTRYTTESPWQGAQTPKELARSRFTLMHGFKNPLHRLSGSPQTVVVKTGHTQLNHLDFGERLFTDWGKLMTYARKVMAIGLRQADPLQEVVCIQPAKWGERTFDHIQQIFRWWVMDQHGRALPLLIEYSPLHEAGIRALERIRPPRNGSWVLVARLVRQAGHLAVLPYTLFQPEKDEAQMIYSLVLDSTAKTSWWKVVKDLLADKNDQHTDWDDLVEESENTAAAFIPALERYFAELEQRVTELAERGGKTCPPFYNDIFEKHRRIFQDSGLSTLSKALERMIAATEGVPRHLLSVNYLLLLHRQAAELALWE